MVYFNQNYYIFKKSELNFTSKRTKIIYKYTHVYLCVRARNVVYTIVTKIQKVDLLLIIQSYVKFVFFQYFFFLLIRIWFYIQQKNIYVIHGAMINIFFRNKRST